MYNLVTRTTIIFIYWPYVSNKALKLASRSAI